MTIVIPRVQRLPVRSAAAGPTQARILEALATERRTTDQIVLIVHGEVTPTTRANTSRDLRTLLARGAITRCSVGKPKRRGWSYRWGLVN